jgi:uncharacterized membrane protein HdeD (DUF308 family)
MQSRAGFLMSDAEPMLYCLAKNWWLVLLRGLWFISFGLATFIRPGMTLVTLIIFCGAFALLDGVLAMVTAIMGGTPTPRGWLAVIGLLDIGAGILVLFWPGITAFGLLSVIAGWAIAFGAMQLVGSIELRRELHNECFLIAGGALSIIFGLTVLLHPGAGELSMMLVLGVYALLCGLLWVCLSLRLRRRA